MIYYLHIGYDGTGYSGWQWQPNTLSIQQEIEDNLEKIFKKKITVFGCGRTDAGVHASQYFLSIEIEELFDFDLAFRLNKNLPEQIVVHDVLQMEDGQHARYDAISRSYDYFIHMYNDPVLHKFSSFYEIEDIDFEGMQRAVALLPKYNDFKALCKQPHLYKHTLCEVQSARIFMDSGKQRIRFTITANRFLRGMIRLILSFLLKIGRREMTVEEFEHILANGIDVPNKMPAFPNGLYLSRVEYPYLKLEPSKDIAYFLKKGFDS